MGICAGLSGGFFQIMSIGSRMTGSNHNSRRSDAGAELALHYCLNIRIDRAADPDTGLISDAAGRRVDQWEKWYSEQSDLFSVDRVGVDCEQVSDATD